MKKDEEYISIEKEKQNIMNALNLNLSEKDFLLVESLLKCTEIQEYITAMFFSFIRVLDLSKNVLN